MAIDDNRFNLNTLIDLLEDEYGITVAISGQMGLEAANKLLHDLIFLYITMPNMLGLEVPTVLKSSEQTKDSPVVFITDQCNAAVASAMLSATEGMNPGTGARLSESAFDIATVGQSKEDIRGLAVQSCEASLLASPSRLPKAGGSAANASTSCSSRA